jgi:hypothetical protein
MVMVIQNIDFTPLIHQGAMVVENPRWDKQ